MLFIFDRGYIGIPLLIYLIREKGKFLFRLPIFAYKKEISKMKKDDEEIIIPINNDRKKNIQEKDLKELAKKLKEIKVRVIKIKLVNLNILIGICKQYLLLLVILGNDERSDEIQDKMLKIIKQNVIAIKSGRKNKRKWSINNKYRTNMRRN